MAQLLKKNSRWTSVSENETYGYIIREVNCKVSSWCLFTISHSNYNADCNVGKLSDELQAVREALSLEEKWRKAVEKEQISIKNVVPESEDEFEVLCL